MHNQIDGALAAGGGHAQVVPMEQVNLHFTGDFHAITSAHNLLAALVDNHVYWGNALGFDTRQISWRRVMDMNDRALRDMVIALGGPANGYPREAGFDITVASEVMAILCLASDLADLQDRLTLDEVGEALTDVSEATIQAALEVVVHKVEAERGADLGTDLLIVGIRPEHIKDADLGDVPAGGVRFAAPVDQTEWLGNEQYAYVPFTVEGDVKHKLDELDKELDGEGMRTQMVINLDPRSRVREGDDSNFVFDPTLMHVFDPESGDCLTRDDAKAAEIARQSEEDRQRALERARAREAANAG